jgi:pimeloyl-ACP methyl ester carboxylesterase
MRFHKSVIVTLVAMLLLAVIVDNSFASDVASANTTTVKSLDGSTIAYGVQGTGDVAIVFVHCWTCNHEFWKNQIDHFAKDYRVVWLDLAGHGLSTSDRTVYTMPAFGQDVAAVINAVAADKVVLVGHSMGGPVAIEAARILGDKVIGIIGVDTFYTPFAYPTSKEKIEEFVKPFKDDYAGTTDKMIRSMFTPNADPAVIESIAKQFAGANPDVGVSALYEIFRWNAKNGSDALDGFGQKLRNINAAPKGDEKPLHGGVTLIPGVGHFVAQVKPDEFNRALEDILVEFQTK